MTRLQRRSRLLGARGSLVHKLGILVVVLVLAAGAATYAGWIPTIDGDSESDPPPALATPPAVVPGIQLSQPPPAAAVLDPVAAQPVRPALLRSAVAPALSDRSLGRSVGFVAADLSEPRAAWSSGDTVVTPASTLKLLTATTALATLGPEHRFRTSVLTGTGRRSIVLVGGGDPLLTDRAPDDDEHPTPATLAELARRTAAALSQQGTKRVRITYDVSLFSGPTVNRAWEADYVPDDVVSPIAPLWVDEGREVAGYAARVGDPALVAAERFAQMLADRGIKVVGVPTSGQAPDGATELAWVDSPPVVEIVQHTLEISDNEAAEVLLRQSALATGRRGSFVGGVQAMRTTLADLGVDLAGARILDGSGLARGNRLPVRALVEVLQLAAGPDHPELNAVATTLPVAGFTGSLSYRFLEVAEDGLGFVRAKTGTLTGVHGLAGVAVTADGRPVAFAVIADRVPVPRTLDARAQLDSIAALLAACSCS